MTISEYAKTLKTVNNHVPSTKQIHTITCCFTNDFASYIAITDDIDETIVPMSENYYNQLSSEDKPKAKTKKKDKK